MERYGKSGRGKSAGNSAPLRCARPPARSYAAPSPKGVRPLKGTSKKYQCQELLRICSQFEAAKRRQNGFLARLCGKKMRTKAQQGRAFRLFRGALRLPLSAGRLRPPAAPAARQGLSFAALVFVSGLLLAGCFGIKTGIVIKKDGSGTISMEYKISNELLAAGTLDGNAAWPAIPVGEADFRRTIARTDGLELSAFSIKKGAKDTIYKIRLKYKTIQALCGFMDARGAAFSYSKTASGEETLFIRIIPEKNNYSDEMLHLLPVIFEGCNFDLKIETPGKCRVAVSGENREELNTLPAGSFKSAGNTFEFSAPMAELFSAGGGLNFEIKWR